MRDEDADSGPPADIHRLADPGQLVGNALVGEFGPPDAGPSPVNRVQAAEFVHGGGEGDEFVANGMRAGLVVKAGREAGRALLHAAADQRGHRGTSSDVAARTKSLPITWARTVLWPTSGTTFSDTRALSSLSTHSPNPCQSISRPIRSRAMARTRSSGWTSGSWNLNGSTSNQKSCSQKANSHEEVLSLRVAEDCRVGVVVDVDEPRGDDGPPRAGHLWHAGDRRQVSDRLDAVAADADVPAKRGAPAAVDHGPAPDDQVELIGQGSLNS